LKMVITEMRGLKIEKIMVAKEKHAAATRKAREKKEEDEKETKETAEDRNA